MRAFIQEFKSFIARGNVMDLAVGVIIGGAFSNITTSLVNDILNPILGIIAGNNTALTAMAVELPGGGALMVGNFINAIVSFLVVSVSMFLVVKAMNAALTRFRLEEKKEEAAAPAPEPSNEEKLLAEIRDLLKEQKQA